VYVCTCYRHANLQCVTLFGWAKGVDCKPGSGVTTGPPNHCWNAVCIDGSWQLVDCHWATRYMQATGNARKRHADNLVYELDQLHLLLAMSYLLTRLLTYISSHIMRLVRFHR